MTQNKSTDDWNTFFDNIEKYISKDGKLPEPWYGPDDMYAPIFPDEDKMPDAYSILIVGERGSGKEFVAKRIAKMWDNKGLQPKCSVNCATIIPNLACSELFGCVEGSHSKAEKSTTGLFGQYETENIFYLDELHRLPVDAQGALLRLIEYREYKQVGTQAITLKKEKRPHIIAAVQPHALNNEELLLPDLEDRFVCTVKVPLLNQCPFSIPRLFAIFLYDTYKNVFYWKYKVNKIIDIQDDEVKSVREAFKKLKFPEIDLWKLMAYTWPSNIRELKNETVQTKINDKNIIEISLFSRMNYDRKKEFNYSFQQMFGIYEKTKGGFELKNVAKEKFVYEHEGIKFIKPLSKDSVNYKTYNTKKKLTLLDLWNYKPFDQQRSLSENKVRLFYNAFHVLSNYNSLKSKLDQERELIDQALISAKKKIYETRATKMQEKSKVPKKPNSFKKLNKIHRKLGTIKKVAEYFQVSQNTIYTWKKELRT
jgi:DNA-binding NtrC family response regulator